MRKLAVLSILLFGIVAACSATSEPSGNASDDNGAGAGNAATNDDGSGGSGATGGTIGFGGMPLLPTGTLTGTVVAPDGTIPINDALIYLTHSAPPPIQQNTHCDHCVELDEGQPYVFSNTDGTFSLEAPTGTWLMVVQKGAFRRMRQIEVVEGTQTVDAMNTRLPGVRNPAEGDEIPKMAVIQAVYDSIELTLAKLGVPATSFDIFAGGTAEGVTFLTSAEQLAQYHIVFFPCDVNWANAHLADPQVQQNLRDFVENGGRLYTTDYAYDVTRQSFPEPITWLGDTGEFDSAESFYYSGVPAIADDQGLADWLTVQGIPAFTIQDAYTAIDKVNTYTAPDENGEMKTFDPKVWVSAQVPEYGLRPTTVSFQYGCGRALFSTYHTESDSSLLPQERALLYILLEVAVCVGDVGPPD